MSISSYVEYKTDNIYSSQSRVLFSLQQHTTMSVWLCEIQTIIRGKFVTLAPGHTLTIPFLQQHLKNQNCFYCKPGLKEALLWGARRWEAAVGTSLRERRGHGCHKCVSCWETRIIRAHLVLAVDSYWGGLRFWVEVIPLWTVGLQHDSIEQEMQTRVTYFSLKN